MVTIKSGGGINSNKTTSVKAGGKVEPRSTAINPAGISQRDVSTAFRKERVEVGPGYSTKPQGDTGIANASKGPAGAGPGGYGRTIYAKGSQSPTPSTNPMPAGRDTLS